MATLNLITIDEDGVAEAMETAAAAGDQFANNGKRFLRIVNAHGSLTRTVNFITQQQIGDAALAVADNAVVIPANGEVYVGPFPRQQYNDSNNNLQITYSDSADSLTVALLELTGL